MFTNRPFARHHRRSRLFLLTVALSLAGAGTAAAAGLPDDIQIEYQAYVHGSGWSPPDFGSDFVGDTSGALSIEALRFRLVKLGTTTKYPGYSICYRTLRAGQPHFDAEVCDWKTSGLPSKGTLQAFNVYLKTPAGVEGSVCYAHWDGNQDVSNRVCDGGYSGRLSRSDTGHNLVTLYAYLAGASSRGTHPRNVWELSTTDRKELAKDIAACTTHDLLMAHHQLIHEATREFLTGHRGLLATFEACIKTKAKKFVPLPYWNPGQTIPPELRAVKTIPGHDNAPLERYDVIENGASPLGAAKPGDLVVWDLCWFRPLQGTAGDEVGEFEQQFLDMITDWHNAVHDSIGGAMANPMDSPVSAIFFPWHAYVDNTYQHWLDCPLRPNN
jgi:hypothetical protein